MHARSRRSISPEIAQRCGYYDQAHMIGDFHQFTGHSPTGYVALKLPDGGGVVGD